MRLSGRGFGFGAILAVLVAPAIVADRLEPTDLHYLGAWQLPRGTSGISRWGYGGKALTFDPAGDEGRGSLIGAGHSQHGAVGECSVAEPSERARQLEPFRDVAGALRPRVDALHLDRLGGLALLEGKVYWSFYRYYAVQPPAEIDDPTVGRNTWPPTAAEGLWKAGRFHQKLTSNYMAMIPAEWADLHVEGRRLAVGKGDGAGNIATSHGPALYAVRTPGSIPGSIPGSAPDGAELDTVELLRYPADEDRFPHWSPCDHWEGLVWLDSAVLVAGRRGRGTDCYGTPDDCGDPCGGGKGYHCQPYEAELVFYAPAELAEVAAGDRAPETVLPYATFDITPWLVDTCHYLVGGMALDTLRNRLYLIQDNGENPLVHTWEIGTHQPPPETGDKVVITIRIGGIEKTFSEDDKAVALLKAMRYLSDALEAHVFKE